MGTEYVIVREQVLTGQTDMDKVLDRLKVLIDSSTPIVVMETVEETRAVRMVRMRLFGAESGGLRVDYRERLAAFGQATDAQPLRTEPFRPEATVPAEVNELAENPKALYNSREPAKMLANLERHLHRGSVHPERLSSAHGRSGRSCGGCAMSGRNSRRTGAR